MAYYGFRIRKSFYPYCNSSSYYCSLHHRLACVQQFKFSEERDVNGDRPGPYNLVIKNSEAKDNPNLIVEKVGGKKSVRLTFQLPKLFVRFLLMQPSSFGHSYPSSMV